ncbi:MAG: cytochrome P450 [Cyanobacteria bacterium P01_D01_bin.14]
MSTIPKSYTPMLLEALQWGFDPLGYAESRARIMGDVFSTNLPPASEGESLIFLNHPQAVQCLLSQDNGDIFSAPGELNALGEGFFGKNSILMQSGTEHRRRRKLLMPPFHGERMKAYGDLICQIAQGVMADWQTGQVITARNEMQKMTMRVILQAVFGLHSGDRYRRLEKLLAERLDAVSSPFTSILVFFPQLTADLGPLSPGGYIKRLSEEIDQLLYAEIEERRASHDPNRSDVLSLLLSAHDESGEGLSDVELRDELMTLLVAGHETTATALAWALYWIHAQPDVKQTLLDELDAHRQADQLTLSRLPYLNAVCNETLRIYPVGLLTLGRRVEKACQIMGYDLKPGDLVTACIYLVHHREDIYPNADAFRPERFLERQYSPYEFLPFGGGSRRCIGSALAMYEMTLILHQILTSSELALAEYQPVKPVRRGATLAPMGGVKLRKLGVRSNIITQPGTGERVESELVEV